MDSVYLTEYCKTMIIENIKNNFDCSEQLVMTISDRLNILDPKIVGETVEFSILISESDNNIPYDIIQFVRNTYTNDEFLDIFEACTYCLSAYGSDSCKSCTPENRYMIYTNFNKHIVEGE